MDSHSPTPANPVDAAVLPLILLNFRSMPLRRSNIATKPPRRVEPPDELGARAPEPAMAGALREAVLESAWKSIFHEKMHRRVVRWLTKLGVPEADLPDIAQTVFEQAIKSFPRYDPTRARPERWLNRIAVHTASRFVAKAYHRREELVDPTKADVAQDDRSSEIEQEFADERRELLLAVIARLPSDHAQILIECDLDGCPIQVFATRYSVPLSTAYKRRTRALAAALVIAHELQEAESCNEQKEPKRVASASGVRPG